MYIKFLSIFSPYFENNKKVVKARFNCPARFEEWIFLDHTFYVFVDEVVMKLFVYLLITNSSLCKNIVNLFKHNVAI